MQKLKHLVFPLVFLFLLASNFLVWELFAIVLSADGVWYRGAIFFTIALICFCMLISLDTRLNQNFGQMGEYKPMDKKLLFGKTIRWMFGFVFLLLLTLGFIIWGFYAFSFKLSDGWVFIAFLFVISSTCLLMALICFCMLIFLDARSDPNFGQMNEYKPTDKETLPGKTIRWMFSFVFLFLLTSGFIIWGFYAFSFKLGDGWVAWVAVVFFFVVSSACLLMLISLIKKWICEKRISCSINSSDIFGLNQNLELVNGAPQIRKETSSEGTKHWAFTLFLIFLWFQGFAAWGGLYFFIWVLAQVF